MDSVVNRVKQDRQDGQVTDDIDKLFNADESILIFVMNHCPYCQALVDALQTLPIKENQRVIIVDNDRGENLVDQLNVTSYPTFYIGRRNGDEVEIRPLKDGVVTGGVEGKTIPATIFEEEWVETN